MQNLKQTLLFLILLLTSAIAEAQTGKLYNTENGLSSSFANQVFQDSRGFIWVATRNGLSVFDGYHFVVINRDNSSSRGFDSNYINKVEQDHQGNILLGSNKGLLNFDGQQFHAYKIYNDQHKLVKTYVNDIVVRRNGQVLIGTSGYGILQPSGKAEDYVCRPVKGAISKLKYIRRMAEDRLGRLWINTEDGRLLCLDRQGRLTQRLPIGGKQSVSSIACDVQGNVYAGTTGDGVYFSRGGMMPFTQVSALGKLSVSCVFVAPSGKVYVGSDGYGLYSYQPTTGLVVNNPFYSNRIDLTTGKVNSIIQDRQGNVWMTMLQKGLYMQPALAFDFGYIGYRAGNNNPIGGNCVTRVLFGDGGTMWVGTDRDGLYLLDAMGKQLRHYTFPNTIEALCFDSHHRLWIGSYLEGCGYLEGGSYHPVNLGQGVSVFDIKCDARGNVWLATLGNGLVVIRPDGTRRTYVMAKGADNNLKVNSLPNNFLFKLAFSRDGSRLFVASSVGMSCLDLKHDSWVTTFGVNCVDQGSFAHSLYVDSRDRVWVGSNDMLYCHDKTHWSKPLVYTVRQGLPDNNVAFMQEDRQQRLWFGTLHGLCCMDMRTGKTQSFFVGNGLQSNEFSDGAASLSADGRRLLVGGPGGINVFDPSRIGRTSWRGLVQISRFLVGNEPVVPGMKSGWFTITEKPCYESRLFSLAQDDNSFSLELTTFTYNNVEQVTYAYSINDEGWKTLTQGQNVLSFAHLPAGKYQFRVKALYNGQSSAEEEFQVEIRPAWYASWPAKFVYLILLVWAFYVYLAYRKRKEQERLTLQEHIHAEEMGEAKLRFFVNISHDIRTPLTLIITPLLSLIKTDRDPQRQNTYALMRRNAERILHLVNQMMDLRKIDKGKMVMHMQKTDMVSFIDDEVQLFQQQANIKKIHFVFHHDSDMLPVWVDRDNFDKVIMNLLSNAFKFTPTGGDVNISLTHTGADAIITVRDTGCGIPKDKLETIFQRFYQSPTGMGERNTGTGIGLDLTRSLVELHYGTITAHNNSGEPGSCFVVTLPLGNSHLKPEEMLADDGSMTPVQHDDSEADKQLAQELKEMEADPLVHPVASRNDNSKPTIAIVEDDDEIASYLQTELSNEYNIRYYPNGKVALAEILKDMPNLVISDVMMPEMDGITLCTKLKSNINTNHLPVILLTAKSRDEDRMEGLETGADAYVVKPFNMDILRRTIANLLAVRRTLKNKFTGQEDQADKVNKVDVQTPDDKFLQRVMDVINDNLSNSDLGVDDIADRVGISRVHLYRKMKELTNQTPHNFIKNLRLKQAARLLEDPKQSITEVMYACGFSNSASFSTMFKNMYGMSPRDYQRSKM